MYTTDTWVYLFFFFGIFFIPGCTYLLLIFLSMTNNKTALWDCGEVHFLTEQGLLRFFYDRRVRCLAEAETSKPNSLLLHLCDILKPLPMQRFEPRPLRKWVISLDHSGIGRSFYTIFKAGSSGCRQVRFSDNVGKPETFCRCGAVCTEVAKHRLL